jgi:hypothetical protein
MEEEQQFSKETIKNAIFEILPNVDLLSMTRKELKAKVLLSPYSSITTFVKVSF